MADNHLLGRLIELHSTSAFIDGRVVEGLHRYARGRAVVVNCRPSLELWLEVEDEECRQAFSDASDVAVGDVLCFQTEEIVIRIVKEPLSDDALMSASAALREALESVARARRLVDGILAARMDPSDAP